MTPRPSAAPVTGTAGQRVRWEPSEYSSSFLGYAGTPASPDHWLFQIFKDGDDSEDSELALMSALPGAAGDYRRSTSMGELKAEAERWLEEFVSSLGAVFEDEIEECFHDQFAPGARVRFAHPDNGYPADQRMAAMFLTPGEVYTIAWSDIGSTSTRLGLAGVETRGQGFNSVLFEPVDDEEPVPPHPEEEE